MLLSETESTSPIGRIALVMIATLLHRVVHAQPTTFIRICDKRLSLSLSPTPSLLLNQGQRDKLADAYERFSSLNGQKIDPLPSNELQEIGESLKRALGHIERIVNLQIKR